jgi:hypothetical protein
MSFLKFKVGLCTLIFACSCILFGCGSDNNSGVSLSRKDQKPPQKQKPKVVELLVNGSPGQGVTTKSAIPREMGSPNLEVTPPEKPGESGVTQQAEIEAAMRASKMIDPQDIEVLPPDKPGERGITRQEIEAAMRASKMIDPQDIEVLPPDKPGERGITRQEIEAAVTASKPIDPQDIEVLPPSRPGGRGVTQREINAITASQKKSLGNNQELPQLPPGPK